MALIEWRDVCSVSVKDLDDQHRLLFALINDYHEAVSRNMTAESTRSLLKGLAQCARTHFNDEEKLMLQHYYPGYGVQKAWHESFAAMIDDYVRRADEGQPTPPSEIIDFLRHWMIKHILAEDRLYGPFLNALGVN